MILYTIIKPWQEAVEVFSFLNVTFCADSYFGIYSTPMLFSPYTCVTTEQHIKDPVIQQKYRWWNTCKHAHTLDLTNQDGLTILSRYSVENHQGNEIKCNSSGSSCPQLSQLTEALRTDLWPKRVEMVHMT